MKAVLVGFPKSGTSTIQRSLARSGLRAVHQKHRGVPVGRLIYDGLLRHGDPFHHLRDVDVITQMDYCRPWIAGNYWPNLDFAVLAAIRETHPDCRLILNYRDPAATADSMRRWFGFQRRIARAHVPGLPAGFGGTQAELEAWIRNHHAALRRTFAGSPGFIEIDIAAADAPRRLGVDIAWWGRANANTWLTPDTEGGPLARPRAYMRLGVALARRRWRARFAGR